MNRFLTSAFLMVATLLLACGGGGRKSGDVTFVWSFKGATCEQVPEVAWVHIAIPDEVLEDGGYFPCLNGGYPGIKLHDFRPGTYGFVIEGLGVNDEILYRATGTFTIDGDTAVSVDLTPLGQPTSYARLFWSFPANWNAAQPDCADATVSKVDVRIDQGAWFRYDCSAGLSQAGAASELVSPGSHTIELIAVHIGGGGEYDVAYATGTIETVSHAPADHSFTLEWTIGGTSVGWQLRNAAGDDLTCEQAKVQTVYVHFLDTATNEYVYDGGDPADCTLSAVTYRYLRPGTYQVWISATSTDGVDYLSPDVGPEVTVTVAEWPAAVPPVTTLVATSG